ncbi:SCAN domain-containing protein 3-like [Osmia lignaria lignaria]|uniref:SCAN domain-containing protein 3-like n=1 Tax=Osmia lignaria lignaria TaxID=1437193 RepID=UPI00402B92C8
MDSSPGTSNGDTKVKAEVGHRYKDSYLKHGFWHDGPENKPHPKCLVCGTKFDNKNMRALILKDHFDQNHRDTVLVDYFTQLRDQQIKQVGSYNVSNNNVLNKNVSNNHVSRNTVLNHLHEANDEVANYEQLNCKVVELIVKNMQLIDMHRAVQYLILPACEEVNLVSHSYSEGTESNVSLSHNSISGYIKKILRDIRQQLIAKLVGKKFSLLLDVHHERHLMSYVRFVDEHSIVEHFLSYIDLTEKVTDSDIYNSIQDMLRTNELEFQHCVSIFVASMDENKNKLFVDYLQEKLPNKTIKCWYDRTVLITQTLSEPLKDIMITVDKMIKVIICSSIGRQISKVMYQKMGSRHKPLLFGTKCWMFRSQAFRAVYDQKEALLDFLTKKRLNVYAGKIRDQEWWSKFAYLADISQIVIDLIKSMQDAESYFFTSIDKVEAFRANINRWIEDVKNRNFKHLSALKDKVSQYFPLDNANEYNWIRNPFALKDEERNHLSPPKQEMLVILSHNREYQLIYRDRRNLLTFWIMAKDAYPELADDALSILLQFSSSYMIDEGRSALYAVTFYKEERLLSVEEELLLHLSTIRPEFRKRIVIDDQSTN